MGNWEEKYLMEDELKFIKGLGRRFFYTSHELSSRIILLQNYLKSFIMRKLNPNIDRNQIISILEEEIKTCVDKGCFKRTHSVMCPRCGG